MTLELESRIEALERSVRRAYEQRANLAVAFAKLAAQSGWAAGRGLDSKVENDMEWRHVLYVDLPNGEQVSYHFAPGDVHLLDGLPTYRGEWDGKYTGTTEWHEMLYAPPPADVIPLYEYAASSNLSGFAWKRWMVEKAKLEADKDVSEQDRERILRGYVKAWSR
jgi:hypothetical protein